MGLPAVIGAAVGLASLVGKMISSHEVRDAQNEMYDKQYRQSMEIMDKQNEYNLPRNQMQRLRDAGLNPQLFFDRETTSATASLPAAPQYQPKDFGLDVGQLMQIASLKLQEKQTDANVRQSDAQANLFQEQALTEQERRENLDVDTRQREQAIELSRQAHDMQQALNEVNLHRSEFDYRQRKILAPLEEMSRILSNDKLAQDIRIENVRAAIEYALGEQTFDWNKIKIGLDSKELKMSKMELELAESVFDFTKRISLNELGRQATLSDVTLKFNEAFNIDKFNATIGKSIGDLISKAIPLLGGIKILGK